MARSNFTDMRDQLDSTIYDNSSGDISGQDVHDMFQVLLNTIRPGYGILTQTAPKQFVLTMTPQPITGWEASPVAQNGYATDRTTGRVTMTEPGIAQVFIGGEVLLSNNTLILDVVTNAEALTQARFIATDEVGSAEPNAVYFFGKFRVTTTPVTFEIQARVASGADVVTFANFAFEVQYIPDSDPPSS